MQVRLYKPSKTAMQSGRAQEKEWVLEFAPAARREVDKLMGWTSSADTTQQLKMKFPTREDAIAFCHRNGLMYAMHEEKTRTVKPKAYADNFAFGRTKSWTH